MSSLARGLARGIAVPTLNLAYSLGLYRALGAWYGGCGVIFSLHRVVDGAEPFLNPPQKLESSILEDLLVVVRRLDCEIVSLNDLHHHLMEHVEGRGHRSHGHARLVCFTLDDGYADNLTIALPIFRKHGVPLTVFIATDIVERTIFYWWGANEELILKNESIELPAIYDMAATTLPAGSLADKIAAYQMLDQLCLGLGEALFPTLRELYKKYKVDVEARLNRDALTIAQVRELSHDRLVAIGAHGVSHRRLSHMSEQDVRLEMEQGRSTLQNWTQEEVQHFAYPFGNANACGLREFALAKDAGFKTALTTRQGNIFPEHRHYLQCLPRRDVPLSRFALRNTLYGIQTIIEQDLRFRTD
jgi:peptidoglycan/xylan/chitin deacetylase (PgdA/CDA1 family)